MEPLLNFYLVQLGRTTETDMFKDMFILFVAERENQKIKYAFKRAFNVHYQSNSNIYESTIRRLVLNV